MKRLTMVKIGLFACALTLMVALVAGCSNGAGQQVSGEAQANRAYMSQVNETMDQLSTKLESFVDAVSRGDVVNMRTQADEAFKSLDALEAIEPPEAFTDIHKSYVDGAKKLREALNDYVTLYSEINSMDQSTFNSRISEIQAKYDEGVKALKDADEKAAALE